MQENHFKDKRVAVLGLAIEGIAVANFLKDKVRELTILDQRPKAEMIEKAELGLRPDIELLLEDKAITKILGDDYLDHLAEFDIIFRTPGISALHPKIQEAKERGIEVSSQIKLFFELCPCQIIGVTGTKGKGTTASLISEILKKAKGQKDDKAKVFLAGNIGYPAITLLDQIRQGDIVVLELSSFQLMDLEKSPHIAVVTNLDVEHQDYHHSVEEYQRAKFNLIAHQEPGDFAILNQSSTFPKAWLEKAQGDVTYFTSSKTEEAEAFIREVDGDLEVVLRSDVEEIIVCRQSEIKLIGRHNLENIAAASLAVWAAFTGQSDQLQGMFGAVKEFEGLPHRLEPVDTIDRITYIDDSFGTTPGPTMAAISSIKQDKVLILGGSSKGADFSELAEKIVSSNVKGVVLIGIEGARIKEALVSSGYDKAMAEGGGTIEEVVANAASLAKPGDVVILSPACASFGMFKNYKDRGEKFRAAVLRLKASKN